MSSIPKKWLALSKDFVDWAAYFEHCACAWSGVSHTRMHVRVPKMVHVVKNSDDELALIPATGMRVRAAICVCEYHGGQHCSQPELLFTESNRRHEGSWLGRKLLTGLPKEGRTSCCNFAPGCWTWCARSR